MLYLSGVVRDEIPDHVGYMLQPGMGNRPDLSTRRWAADNGCFTTKGTFNEAKWVRWMTTMAAQGATCLFATAPDVVGNAAATLERSLPWLRRIRELGYSPAFVAQDGIENTVIPWDEFDCLFIGGSTEFKLGPVAKRLVVEAHERGKWVHMGRVNSWRRVKIAADFGCDSVDGTYLKYGPSVNLPKLLSWVARLDAQPGLAFA